MTGCGSSKETEEEIALKEELESVDFNKAIEETKTELLDPYFFEYVKDISINIDNDDREIVFIAILDNDTNKKTAVNFADMLIRRFSGKINNQNHNLKGEKKNYLGEVYDYYKAAINVSPYTKTDNIDKWYVNSYIKKGTHKKRKANKNIRQSQ